MGRWLSTHKKEFSRRTTSTPHHHALHRISGLQTGWTALTHLPQTLTPTPVTHSVAVTGFTGEGESLVVAKPDRVEVWDVTTTGLVFRGELTTWGTIAGLAVTNITVSSDAKRWLTVRMLDLIFSSLSDLRMRSFTWLRGPHPVKSLASPRL